MSPDFLPSLLSNIWSVFLIILFFGGSIFVHELGHFLAARRRGVKVERFSIGFGPAIFKWRGQDGVEYRIAWLPLGGYVALPQLADLSGIEGETETPAEELPPVSYSTRMLVFVAGATFNVIFAFVLAAVLWQIGRPAPENITTTKIGYILPTLKRADGKEVESPATKSKLQVGDIIRRVDGREVSDWVQFKSAMVLSTKVDESGTRDVVLTIERDGKLQDVRLEPERTGDEGFRTIGVISAYTAVVDSVLKGSSGEKLGFKAGDRFIAFDHTPAVSFDQLSDYLRVHRDQPVVLTLERLDGTHVDITLPPTPKDKPHPFNGIMISIPYKLLYHTPWHQFREIIDTTYRTLVSLLSPRGDVSVSNLSGPIGIVRGFWDAAQSEYPIRFALWFAVLVNLNLAIFNLMPIPVLDGGQMLFATIGRIRGRALPVNFVLTTQSVFVVLLLSLIMYISFFDVQRIRRDYRAEQQAREAAEQAKKAETAPTKP